MSSNILQNQSIDVNNIGQMQTTKYGVIAIFDLEGRLVSKLLPTKYTSLNEFRLNVMKEIQQSEDDPRTFINTANDDLIRSSVIGCIHSIENKGIVIYNSVGKLILWFDEPNNNAIEDIIGQIEAYPTLPKEEWNPYPMEDDPEDFIEPINWDIRLF